MDKDSLVNYWKDSGMITDERVIKVFLEIPREDFILPEFKGQTYDDRPLPILKGQTISQPTTVVIMLQALELRKEDIVLEIGTGSGYNAALLSRLCKEVYTAEIIPELIEFARRNLSGYKNVHIIQDNGSLEFGRKFDRIIITAACPKIPEPLVKQLKDGGVIVAPIGPCDSQKLIKAIKEPSGLKTQDLGGFMFVPMKGEFGY